MTAVNSQAKAIFDIALANQWYAVLPAVFKSSLKDILVEKYVRAMIQESPQDFTDETIEDSEETQWTAVGYRVASMRTLSYMLATLVKHRDDVLDENEGDANKRKTAKTCDEILKDIRKHCDRQVNKLENPQHRFLVQEVIDKVYDDAETTTTSS